MKIRTGFVSNSSSSSFILKSEEEAEKFRKLDIKLYDIKTILADIKDRKEKIHITSDIFPIMKVMFDRAYYSYDEPERSLFIEDILEIENREQELKEYYEKGYIYITHPYDRDCACEEDISDHELWLGDL